MEFSKFKTSSKLKKQNVQNQHFDSKANNENLNDSAKSFKSNLKSENDQKSSNNIKKNSSINRDNNKNEKKKLKLLKTQVSRPSDKGTISCNWKKICELNLTTSPEIKSSEKSKISKKRSNAEQSTETQEKSLSAFAAKRKRKRLNKKLRTKSDQANYKKKRIVDENDVKEDKKKDLWFEVDDIYLDKMANPGGAPVMAKTEHLVRPNASSEVTRRIAIDCEMVGIGSNKKSVLARISIVNQFGVCLYDKFVKPEEKITDYRTFVSGIRSSDLVNGEHIDIVRQEVADLFRGRILIGHSIHNDLKVLMLRHPKKDIRDTSLFFKHMFDNKRPSLKRLSQELLNINIQSGEHSSVEDAQATMRLYTMYKKKWEASLKKKIVMSSKKNDGEKSTEKNDE